MISTGLLSHLEAAPEHAGELEDRLRTEALVMVREPGTVAWFSFRYGRSDYGTFAVFPDDAARRDHLARDRHRDPDERPAAMLAEPPVHSKLDVYAHKLPEGGTTGTEITKGVLLTFEPRHDRDEEIRRFLMDSQEYADAESGTAAWFAVGLDSGQYGIFDVFPDNAARLRHLTGHVPRELAKEAFTILGSMPEVHLVDVVSTTLTPQFAHT